MDADTTQEGRAERGHVTRAVEVTLDPSPSQERWLRSYVGSMRAAYNWALGESATTSPSAQKNAPGASPRMI